MAKQNDESIMPRVPNCIMPEMPYCPACPCGYVKYPDWVEDYNDIPNCECEWICTLVEGEE